MVEHALSSLYEPAQGELELGPFRESLERSDDDTKFGDRDVSSLEREAPHPSRSSPWVMRWSLAREQDDDRERVAQVDGSELGCGAEHDIQVPRLKGPGEVRVRAPLDRHERMFPLWRHGDAGSPVRCPRPSPAIGCPDTRRGGASTIWTAQGDFVCNHLESDRRSIWSRPMSFITPVRARDETLAKSRKMRPLPGDSHLRIATGIPLQTMRSQPDSTAWIAPRRSPVRVRLTPPSRSSCTRGASSCPGAG